MNEPDGTVREVALCKAAQKQQKIRKFGQKITESELYGSLYENNEIDGEMVSDRPKNAKFVQKSKTFNSAI